MNKRVLITGNSSGLGLGLTEACLQEDYEVYGLSRRGYSGQGSRVHDVICDLEKEESINSALTQLLDDVEHLDLVFLNAGIFGKLNSIADTKLSELEQIMQVNEDMIRGVFDRDQSEPATG